MKQDLRPDNQDIKDLPDTTYDVVIIGAGVVGCAMARRFALEGASVLTLEKGADILDGASKGNSAILHTGFDAPPGSLEQKCMAAGYQEYLDIREQLNLPLLETGALVIAWTEEEEAKLDDLMQKARDNGVNDIEMLSAKNILIKEPNLSPDLRAGFYVPREFVIDPWSAPYAYMLQAVSNGAKLLRNTEVTDGNFDGELWRLETSKGQIKGRTVINCAGLYGDLIDKAILKKNAFDIHPRKGQFVVFDKSASQLVKPIILPVPSEKTKGVVVFRTIFGNLAVGPTADEQESRDDASVDHDTLMMLRKKGEEIIPALAGIPVTATYAGIRPATQFKEYCIEPHPDQNYLSVGGIRSTGLTAALGIAQHVFDLYEDMGKKHEPISEPVWPKVPVLAQDGERDWKKPGNGGIVCHCEMVTKREIEDALSGPLAVTSLDGLKRRTRVTMGCCQGFNCSAELSEITDGHFDNNMGEPICKKTPAP